MSEEKGGDAKWSSEFFNFLRLFDRFGTRVVGLLVLQLAWAVAVTIIPKHTPEHGPARISVPRWGPDFPWVLHPIPIGVVYAEGVVIVFALWMLRSRAYLIVVRPLTTLFRALAAMSLGVVSLFAGVTLGLALCVEFRLRKSRPPAWRSAIKKAVEETRRKAPRRQQGTHPRSRTPRRFCDRCSHRLDVFANLDRGSPWFFADRVGEMCERLDAWILRRLISVGYIGIAPIASVSLEEDEKAAKAAMQNFAQALARLRLLLRSLPTSPYVRFIAVPPALSASVVQRADRLRRVLGLDALLYGSYQSVEPPRIWMNLARPIPPPKWISGKGTALAVADPIEVDPSIRFSMALIDQRDPFDAYIVLSLALAETLRSRQLRWLIDDSFRGKLLRYAPLIYSVSFNDESDPLSSSRKDRLAIVGHLVEDVLLQVPQPSGTPPNEAMRLAEALRRQDDSPETVIFPTAKRVLLEFVLEWLDDQLNADPELGDGVTRRLLRDAILRALELCPHHAAYWYRLAILNCMDETLDEACDALRRGIAFDREFRWRDRYDLRADAVNRLPALNRYSRKAEVGYAGVYAARAIARCDGFRTELFDEFKKSDLWSFATDIVEQNPNEKPSAGFNFLSAILGGSFSFDEPD